MVELTPRKLRVWNLSVAALQLICGIAIFILSKPKTTTRKLPVYTNFQAGVNNSTFGDNFYATDPKKQFSTPIGILAGIFLILSGLHHLFVALPGVNAIYNGFLAQNKQPYRWIEYSSEHPAGTGRSPGARQQLKRRMPRRCPAPRRRCPTPRPS